MWQFYKPDTKWVQSVIHRPGGLSCGIGLKMPSTSIGNFNRDLRGS